MKQRHDSLRLLILHCPAGGGHKAAGDALAEHAATIGAQTHVLDALGATPRWFGRGYVQAHLTTTKLAPAIYGYGYDRLNRRHPTLDRVRRKLDWTLGQGLVDMVLDQRPDMVIATHFYPLAVLGRARLRGKLPVPLIGVVTDYAAHAFWAEPGVDLFCTAPGGAALDLVRHGVPATAVIETGIPIRPAFGRVAPWTLDPAGSLRVLMTSGGTGIGPLEEAIRSFAGLPQLQLTVVCGADDKRRAQAQAAADRAGVRARVIGFERDMPARLAEAHIIVGKAGGLTVSECLASGRPMALFGICPGQEQHNADWLRLNDAAVMVEPRCVGRDIDWLRRQGRLGAMAAAARSLGRPAAAKHIIDRAQVLHAPLHAA